MNNVDEKSMQIPKKKSVVLSAFLCIITFGIYPLFWFLKRTDEVNNLQTKTKAKKGLAITAFTLYIVSSLVYLIMWTTAIITDDDIATIDILSIPLTFQIFFGVLVLLLLALFIAFIMLGFNIRTVLNEASVNKGVKRKVSGLFTFFLNFLYLQYEINRTIDDKETEKRIGPWVWFIILYIIPTITGLILYILDLTGVYSLP